MRKIFVVTGLFVFGSYLSLWSQSPLIQQKAILVKRTIELNHFSPRPVDDSFSVTMFNKIIRTADAGGRLFTDADYKALSVYRSALDDELQRKGWVFFDLF